jgi:hypothetical protein
MTHISSKLLLLAGLIFSACANPIPPEGGPRDTSPPALDSLNSTRNYQTRFAKQTVVLAFDEWVELRDAFTQIVISPPLEHRPQIIRKKKTIQVSFDEREVLRDSATYVINFGQAIRDLTEGNVAPIVFVFSTGDYIDSLSVPGTIADAYTGKAEENVLFMLYENLSDSVVYKDRPFYFARTDKEGRFNVTNVKGGNFKAFALLDQNLNYRFDSDVEKIAFLDSILLVQGLNPAPPGNSSSVLPLSDSAAATAYPGTPALALRLFEEEKPLFLQTKETGSYGMVKLSFNREPHDALVRFDSIGQVVYQEMEKDTIRLWYHAQADTADWKVYVRRDSLVDTVLVRAGLKAGFPGAAALRLTPTPAGAANRQPPGQPYALAFNHPLAALDSLQIKVFEDSSRVEIRPRLYLDTLKRRQLVVDYPWKEGKSYEVAILAGAVTDIFGLANADSLGRSFTTSLAKDFGTLTLKVSNLDTGKAYLLRLLDKNGGLVQAFRPAGVNSFQQTLKFLTPGLYELEIIEDLDRNGRWTTGSYPLRRQPERVQRKALEELRANWEMESAIDAAFR